MKQIALKTALLRLIATLFLMIGTLSASAQYYMQVHQKDGNLLTIPVASVDSVSYVTAYDIAPYVITLNMRTASIKVAETLDLTASITKNAISIDGSVTWSSSDNSVASVSSDGKVRGVKAGECDIIASFKSSQSKCHITVLSSESIGGLVLYQAYADSTDITSFEMKAQIDGLSSLEEGSYYAYFYYSTTITEPDESNGTRVKATINDGTMATYSLTNMDMGTTYFFRVAVVTFEGDLYYGPVNSFTVKDLVTKGEKIDLGIPGLLFASCNLGADSPEQIGDLYAWGETESKTTFNSSNYIHYNSNLDLWKGLGTDISGTKYDAATAVLGEGWHMPNEFIVNKLFFLSWKKILYKGVSGYLVIGFNGNCLFIPGQGIWTSSYSLTSEQKAISLIYSSLSHLDRYNGYPIRPVYGNIDYPMEYVDLGLSVKWATCNVGGIFPFDYGIYFAWGETETNTTYAWKTYKYCNGSESTLTKYNGNSVYGNNGFTDDKTILDFEDDVANAKWGGNWRMPTQNELSELSNTNNCIWTWTTLNGVIGYQVTSKISGYEGTSIFLPAAGVINGTNHRDNGSSGYYWSSSLNTSSPYSARGLYFYRGSRSTSSHHRYYGFSVRPVFPSETWPRKVVKSIELNSSEVIMTVGDEPLQIIAIPRNENGDAIDTDVEWSTSDNAVAKVTKNGQVYPVGVGFCTIIAAVGEVQSTCTIMVNALDLAVGYESVDLGLSVKWATCNVGAATPEEYGDYFAWGDSATYYEYGDALYASPVWKTGKSVGYNWSTYKYCKGSNNMLTKYCSDSSYGNNGFTDTLTILLPEDDVAHVKWGGDWRMPTYSEFEELIDNCDWTWTTQNGVDGCKVTSRKDSSRSIFLPATGYRGGTSLYYDGSFGYYWSSSLDTGYPDNVWYLRFTRSRHDTDNYFRFYGLSVRPVCP